VKLDFRWKLHDQGRRARLREIFRR
jgi:hypothetical protein